MSLLEDVFLEDEAGEAQELERIIEGDEFEERPRSRSPDSDSASEKEDEAEEEKRRVDPTTAKPKRVVKNPRFILNPARLTGPRGIQVLPEHFKDFKFKGKGHEKEDLDMVLKKLEHWAYRLYPKFKFEDCLKKIETLGKKRPVQVTLHKIRTDQFASDETVVQKDSSDEEPPEPIIDEFDILLQQQIELARATPAPSSVKKGFETPGVDRSLMMPKATSSPSINDEQRERMIKNRRLAEERRLARLKQNSNDNNANTSNNNEDTHNNSTNTSDNNQNAHDNRQTAHNNSVTDNFDNDDNITAKKHNKSNIIDSSDDENDNSVVNQSITVDIHDNSKEISRHNHNDVDNLNVTDKQMAGDNQTDIMEEAHNHSDNGVTDEQMAGDNQKNITEKAHNDNSVYGNQMAENNQTDIIEEANNHNDNGATDVQMTGDNQTDIIIEEAHNHNDIDKRAVDKETDIHNYDNEIINSKSGYLNGKINDNVDDKESTQQNTETKNISATELQRYDNEMTSAEENNDDMMDVDFNDDF